MAGYRFSEKALDDLTEIWDYTIKEWSEKQAEKYYDLILSTCKDLAVNPQLGKYYNVVTINVLGYKCGQHIIFYQQALENQIVIVRVLHVNMDLRNKI